MRNHFAFAAFVLAISVAALAPNVAHAGGCTPCETSAECVAALGEPAFCIVWTDGSVACPGMPTPERGCCPGQGCATFSGRPSCEAEGRCSVVEDIEDAGSSGSDAGATDAGATDAGGSGPDASGTTMDSGASAADMGTTGRDAGRSPASSGGCACRVSGGPSTGALFAIAIVLGGVVARRRRGPLMR